MMSENERDVQRGAWTERVDHEVASANIFDTTFQNGNPITNLQSIIQEQIATDKEVYTELLCVGMHFIPLDSDNNLTDDDTLHQAYSAGVTMALATLDALCERLDIDISIFRRAWRINGLVTMLDMNHDEKTRSLSLSEKNEAVASGILAAGHGLLDKLGGVYDPIIDSLGTFNRATANSPNVARGSFGYILQGGLTALNKVLLELEARRLTDELDYERALNEWANDPFLNVENSLYATYETIDHTTVADDIDTAAFYVDEGPGVESYIGKIILEHGDSDDQACDIIASLAAARYPNELNALDFVGEAFFHGGIIGLKIVREHTELLSLPKIKFYEEWRNTYLHEQAEDFGGLSDEEEVELLESINRIIDDTNVPVPYSRLLDKLAYALGLDKEDTFAFIDGFKYVYGTSSEVVRSQSEPSIDDQVENASMRLDEELRKLFGDL